MDPTIDPMEHPIDPGNEAIRNLRHEVAQLRTIFPNPPTKDCPIVLVPGFSGWGRPLLGTVNYFGGFEDLQVILSQLGYIVIVVRIGPISSNRERACEIFEQLSVGTFDLPGARVTYIPLRLGTGHPAPAALVANAKTPQAVLYAPPGKTFPGGWRWGADKKVNFICHSQGGTTVRYLIELLSGTSDPNLPQFRGTNRQSWIKSVVTLGTPHKGTTVTGVVNDLLTTSGLDPLIDFITSCSFEGRPQRIYDLHLDHWGFSRTGRETYQSMRRRIVPGVTLWWNSRHNGLYDNSVRGVQDLDIFAPQPSPDTYYFTMSFNATRPFPTENLTPEDINAFWALFPLGRVSNPLGVLGHLLAPIQQLGTSLGAFPSFHAVLTWITDIVNRHLPSLGYHFQVPRPGSQIPRSDMLPLIIYPAYAVGGRTIPAGIAFPGITDQSFQENDGIVNTRSMDGPTTGPVDRGSFTAQLDPTDPDSIKRTYWSLGINTTMDHADQIGVFTDHNTFNEVQVIYMLFAELGDRLR